MSFLGGSMSILGANMYILGGNMSILGANMYHEGTNMQPLVTKASAPVTAFVPFFKSVLTQTLRNIVSALLKESQSVWQPLDVFCTKM